MKIVVVVVGIAIVVALFIAGGFLTSLLWNFILHGLFSLPEITWLHGAAINFMLSMVGAAFRSSRS